MERKEYIVLPGVMAVLPDEVKRTNIIIKDQKIYEIVDTLPDNITHVNAWVREDVRGLFVFPGFIDPHVHFRTPGNENAENWVTGSRAALFAGVTTVLDMPNTTPPVVDAPSWTAKEKAIRRDSLINYGIIPGYTGDNLEFLSGNLSFKAVKVFLASSTGNLLLSHPEKLAHLEALDKKIILHSELESRIINRSSRYSMKNIRNHSRIRDEESAFLQTKEIVQKFPRMASRMHFAHVSTEKELSLLINQKISFEVSPNHIFIHTNDYDRLGAMIKCNPPVRKKSTADKLYRHLLENSIPMIATDHAPHLREEKMSSSPPSGIPSIQVGTHLILDALKKTPLRIAEILSTHTAEFFGMEKRGKITPGYFADLAVVDFHRPWEFQEKDVLSGCGWSPYAGRKFLSRVVWSFVNGKAYDTGKLSAVIGVENETKVYNVWRN